MEKHPILYMLIESHTCNIGGKVYNKKLSERRAEAVKAFRVKNRRIEASVDHEEKE